MDNLTRTERRILALAATQGLKCAYCGKGVHLRPPTSRSKKRNAGLQKRKATLEHVEPRTLGGSNASDNVVIACHYCNNRKGGRAPKRKERERLRAVKAMPRNPWLG